MRGLRLALRVIEVLDASAKVEIERSGQSLENLQRSGGRQVVRLVHVERVVRVAGKTSVEPRDAEERISEIDRGRDARMRSRGRARRIVVVGLHRVVTDARGAADDGIRREFESCVDASVVGGGG